MSFLRLHRLGGVDLDEVGLRLWTLAGYQEISRLSVFHLELDFLEDKLDQLSPDQVLGRRIVFSVDEPFRSFAGIVSRFSLGEVDRGGRRTCRAEVVPELWKLTQILNSRKYSPQKVVQLVELAIQEASLELVLEDRTAAQADRHPVRVNPTQYDETTMNFLGRLMAEEGIFYFVRDSYQLEDGQAVGDQVLVLGDDRVDYDDLQLILPYQPTANVRDANAVGRWERQYQYRPSRWQIQDYDYHKSQDFNMTVPGAPPGPGPFVKFQRAARFYDKDYAKHRLDTFEDREAVHREYVVGESLCQQLYPGAKIKLAGHPAQSENGFYVVTAVEHWAIEHRAVHGPPGEYQSRFVCVPEGRTVVECPRGSAERPQAAVTFAPASRLRGAASASPASASPASASPASAAAPLFSQCAAPQLSVPAALNKSIADLATVVDSQGARTREGQVAVFKDDLGIDHIYVRYQWDTEEGWTSDNRRVRVTQPWAGAGWGTKYLPRIGQEVVVLFINGDPDNQDNVVLGTLSNDRHHFPQPSTPPEMQTVKIERQPAAFSNRRGYAPRLSDAGYPHYLGSTGETEPVTVPALHSGQVSGIRTRSYDSDNQNERYNELLFDDTRDGEQIYVHAARDLNILVDHDLNIEVRGDKKEVIRGNHYQVVCVGNIGPETGLSPTSTDRAGGEVQQDPYPPTRDVGSFGVFRGVTDGVSFDVDKTIGRKSVEFVRNDGGDYVWRQKVETYIDQETREKGNSKTVSIGNSESYRWEGNDFAFFGGSQESVFMGLQMGQFVGGQQSLFLGIKLEFGFSLDIGYSFSLKLRGEDSLGINNRVFTVDKDQLKLDKRLVAIEDRQTLLTKGMIQVKNYAMQIENLKTRLHTAETNIRDAKLDLTSAKTRITKVEVDVWLGGLAIFS